MAKTVIMLCGALVLAASMPAGASPKQAAHRFRTTVKKEVTLDYLLYLPPDYGKTEEKAPLMLFLHGMGERGDDLEKVKKHGPPKLIQEGWEFPFIVVSPQCPRWSWWPAEVKTLDALLDKICKKYRVDKRRIYLTGLSMGGYGTWALAEHQPRRFAAIAPVCGGHEEPEKLAKIAHVPVWAFHGRQDQVVPVERSREIIRVLEKAGGDPKLTTYPDTGHHAWKKAYRTEKLYEWMLSHRTTKQAN